MGDSGRRFSEAEVDAILRRAVARQEHGQSLSRDELADVLRQLNLDESVLDEAIEEHGWRSCDCSWFRPGGPEKEQEQVRHPTA